MNDQGLRLMRITALGFMPGWNPQVQAVGPWRPISLLRRGRNAVTDLSLSAALSGDTGVLSVEFTYDGPRCDFHLVCDGREAPVVLAEGKYSAKLHLPGIKPWWPHTHGEPALYDVALRIGTGDFHLARTGFRSVNTNRGTDGDDFAVIVNGEKIFCRGSVWTSADIVGLPGDRARYEPWLRLAKDAGMNMIRVPGIATYESPAFFALCDELGLMVWQDFMFANFDHPVADPDFVIHVKSEVGQQGAMLDLPYVANSPSGGVLPFYPHAGVAHYYGIGAYKRPLEDARRANVRFAAECLAFSNLAAEETLAGGRREYPATAERTGISRIRDHYLGELYGVDPQKRRSDDLARYLDLSRAVTGEVMEATFAEWRRPGSTCSGALTFTFQDVMPGPGWGVVGADGRPKPAWFALKRAFRPVQLLLADEGTNGLDMHLINETAAVQPVLLEIACLREGKMPVVSGRRKLTLEPRSGTTLACTDLFGAFFDTNYAYRFGPPSHDVTVARLTDRQTGEIVADAFHFPIGRAKAMHDAKIAALLVEDERQFWLELSTDVFAQSVFIAVENGRPADNGFHLAPGVTKRIELVLDPVSNHPARLRELSVRSQVPAKRRFERTRF